MRKCEAMRCFVGAESVKLYCRNVGLVVDDVVRLVEITSVP